MPKGVGQYDHLNEKDKLMLSISLDQLAAKVEAMNYGTQRFLSALVRVRRAQGGSFAPGRDVLTDVIEKALNEGHF